MSEQINILCVDDEPNVLSAVKRVIVSDDWTVHTAQSVEEGLNILRSVAPVQLVISDYRMPEMNGVEFLKQVCSAWPDTVRIVLSGHADTEAIIAAVNEGQIYKFILKPWNPDELKVAVINSIALYELQQQNMNMTKHLQQKGKEYDRLNATLQWLVADKTAEMNFQSKSFEFFQNVFHALPVASICINAGGFIVQSNRRARDYFKTAGISISNRKRTESLPPDWNLFIDGLDGTEPQQGTVSGAGRELAIKGIRAAFSSDEDGVILIFNGDR